MQKTASVFVAIILVTAGLQSITVHGQRDNTVEKNKTLAQRFHFDVIEKRNLQAADDIIAPDCVIHLPTGTSETQGPQRAKQVAGGDHRMFPKDIKITHDMVVAEGDVVMFHWTLVGTRESGEQTTFQGIDAVRLSSGKIAEMWLEYHEVKK